MTPEDYRALLIRLWAVAFAIVAQKDEVAAALELGQTMDTIAPIVDPSLWVRNGPRFEEDRAMLLAFRAFALAIGETGLDRR